MSSQEQAQIEGVVRPVRLLGRAPALDGVRAIAVLLVVFFHARLTKVGIPRDLPTDELIKGGFIGVDLFFVLSGFLITALLLREQALHAGVRVGSFYGRRALRLLPVLYLVLAVHLLFVGLMHFRIQGGLRLEGQTLLSAFFYYANWHTLAQKNVALAGLGHLWSLSIEEQFYVIWPVFLVLFFGIKRSATAVTLVLGTVIVAVAVHRAMLWNEFGWGDSYYRTDARIDGLLIGALLASLWVRDQTPRRGLAPAAWLATAVLFTCAYFTAANQGFWNGAGFSVVAIATAVIILASIDSSWAGNKLLSLAPLRAVGRVSYGIYLWHFPVFWAVGRWGRSWPWPVRMSVAFGVTALLTVASWTLLEKPVMRWRKRFERGAPIPPGVSSATAAG